MSVRKSKGPAKKAKSRGPAKRAKARRVQSQSGLATTLRPHAAGIDVHSREHWVCVPESAEKQNVAASAERLPANVRKFGTCTVDLEQLADWLAECGVKTVAMESTGVYW